MKYAILLFFCQIGAAQIAQAQDWANLHKYRSENATIGLPAENETRVVFIGNSITAGWIDAHPDFFSSNGYIDRGIGGQTTPQILLRFQQDVIALHPKIVVILAGINDIAGNTGPSSLKMIEDNLASMAVLAKDAGIKVVLSSVLPAKDFPWVKGKEPADKVIALNKWIKHYAEKNGHVYLDYYSHMNNAEKGLKKEYTYDGIHPNSAGYKVMEPLVQKAIASALGNNL